jgi:transposase-like protein
MDRAWLTAQLTSGRSIESIAREVDRDPSTVAYWVNKHGLASQHAARHAARGGIERARLEELVELGLTVEQIAAELTVGGTTVRYWLKRHGLVTARARLAALPGHSRIQVRRCRRHGFTPHIRTGSGQRYRCRTCRVEAVSARRRRVKQRLVDEAGGACHLCGYARYTGAMQFHHVDPEAKAFSIADRGVARSLERARAEARKCVLVCANCHAEVEAGVATIARPASVGDAVATASCHQHTGRK